MKAETTETKTKPHHGLNVMICRRRQGKSQDNIADELNERFDTKYFQGDISKFECQEEIADEVLEQFAAVLNCPVEYLKNFDIDDKINSYYSINYGTMSEPDVSGEHASNIEQSQIKNEYITTQENIYESTQKVSELYERLIQKEGEIARLEAEIKALKKK